jgi:hypothetical protein
MGGLPLRTGIRMTAIGVALLSGFSGAMAAGSSSVTPEKGPTKSLSTSMLLDKLPLTSQQQKFAWQDISIQARTEDIPIGFAPEVGGVAPSALMTYPVPLTTSSKVPKLRRYQYVLLANNKLLIINPEDRKVVDIITN